METNQPTRIDTVISELWHTARIAGHSSRYDRMIYVKQWLLKEHAALVADLSPKKLWFMIDEKTRVYN